jgi:hypothetical protein
MQIRRRIPRVKRRQGEAPRPGRTDASVSDLMSTVKARSSKWVHETCPELQELAWQERYGVFSISKSQEDAVKMSLRDRQNITRSKTSSRSCHGFSALTVSSLRIVTYSTEPPHDCRIPLPLGTGLRFDSNFHGGSVGGAQPADAGPVEPSEHAKQREDR